MNSMKCIVVAYDKNNGIGAKNDLLWQRDLPADLQRFKELTTGQAIIMGRKTYESIGRPLPNRQNIVISREADVFDGAEAATSLEDAYRRVEPGKGIFVIGGGQIYQQSIAIADQVDITRVHHTFEADTFFPEIDLNSWQLVFEEFHPKDERHEFDFTFQTYVRK